MHSQGLVDKSVLNVGDGDQESGTRGRRCQTTCLPTHWRKNRLGKQRSTFARWRSFILELMGMRRSPETAKQSSQRAKTYETSDSHAQTLNHGYYPGQRTYQPSTSDHGYFRLSVAPQEWPPDFPFPVINGIILHGSPFCQLLKNRLALGAAFNTR